MTTQLTEDTKVVLKLDLGENGVRRIPLSKLWDKSRSVVSYQLLLEVALEYSQKPTKALRKGRLSVTTTYTDEDGDEITISSDEELAEAFSQFVNSEPPVVRAKTVIINNKKAASNPQKPNQERVPIFVRTKLDNLNVVDPPTKIAPVKRIPPKNADTTREFVSPKPIPSVTDGLDANFIHGRHTCDGCLSTPIYGIRYHATNMPDYDLCSSCHRNYQGSEIVFKPMQLDRDRHLQSRWQRRQMRRCRPMVKTTGLNSGGDKPCRGVKSGTQTKKVINGMDDALKEAIRRSLVDAWPTKKTSEEESSTKSTTTEDKKVEIPVATVVDVSPGNEHTQKALNNMNPKTKEALSRSLNEFFAGRTSCNEKCTPKDEDLNLSPDEETQKKIDSMNSATKEAVRRSLNNFFATRRSMKQNKQESDKIKRTQDILDGMDQETKERISRNLNEFFARRLKQNKKDVADSDEEQDNVEEQVNDEIQAVVVDLIVDDDDDDLSEGSEGTDQADTEDAESKLSEDTNTKDDWQMVTEDDEMLAMAAQMLGSALFQSDSSAHSA
jgi:hypothetical protein